MTLCLHLYYICDLVTHFFYFRNNYRCAVLAARTMVPQKSGLIVNISSAGGLKYLFNVPYGVGKTGVSFFYNEKC